MKTFSILAALLLSLSTPSGAQSTITVRTDPQPNGAYWHESTIGTHPIWMDTIPDNTPLSALNIPATHDTMSLVALDITQTQSLTAADQLAAGVRGFDLRCLQRNDLCLFVHGPVIQGTELAKDFLKVAQEFLQQNPSETLIARIQSETTELTPPINNQLSFDQMIAHYVQNFSSLFWDPKNSAAPSNPPLSEIRGRIVILRNYALNTSNESGIDYNTLNVQDNYQIDTPITEGIYAAPNGFYKKWQAIKAQFIASSNGAYHTIYGNFLSGSSGNLLEIPATPIIDLSQILPSIPNYIPPFFIASGHAINATFAARLGTGIINQCARYLDFPCLPILLVNETFYEGSNILAMQYLNALPQPQRIGIVFADFIGTQLIQAIIQQNFARTKGR